MSSIVQYLPETLSVTMRVLEGPEKKMTLVRKPGVVVAKGLLLRLENGRELYLLHAFNNYVTHNRVRDGYRDYPHDSFEVLRFLFVEGHESSLGHLLQRFTPEEVARLGSTSTAATAAATSTLSVPSLPLPLPLPFALTFQEKLARLPPRIPASLKIGEHPATPCLIEIRDVAGSPVLYEGGGRPLRSFFNTYLYNLALPETSNHIVWSTDIMMLAYFFVEHPVKASLGLLLETGDVAALPLVGIAPTTAAVVVEPPKPVNEVIMPVASVAAAPDAVAVASVAAAPDAVAVASVAAAPDAVAAPPMEDIKLTLTDHFRETEKANVKRLQYRVPAKLSVDLEYDSNYATDITVEMDGTFSLVTQAKKAYSGLNSLEVLHYLSYGTERSMLESKAVCDPFYGLERLYYVGVRKSLGFYIRLKATRPAAASTNLLDVRVRISLERKKSRRLHSELAEYTELEKQIEYNKKLEARLAALKASLA